MKKKKKHIGWIIFLVIIIAIVIAAPFVYKKMRMKVVGKIVDETVLKDFTVTLPNGDETEVHFEDVIKQLEPQDQQKVEDLMDKYMTTENAGEVAGIVKDGLSGSSSAREELKEYVEENVDEADVDYLKDLYEKYNDGSLSQEQIEQYYNEYMQSNETGQ